MCMGPLQLVKKSSESKPNPNANLLVTRRVAVQKARRAKARLKNPHNQPGKRKGVRNKSGGGARVRTFVVMVPLDVALAFAAGVTLVGASVQVENAGAPVQVSATVPVKLVMEVTLTVKLAVAPAAAVPEAGCTETVKSGVPEAVPVPVSVTVCVRLPLELVS